MNLQEKRKRKFYVPFLKSVQHEIEHTVKPTLVVCSYAGPVVMLFWLFGLYLCTY